MSPSGTLSRPSPHAYAQARHVWERLLNPERSGVTTFDSYLDLAIALNGTTHGFPSGTPRAEQGTRSDLRYRLGDFESAIDLLLQETPWTELVALPPTQADMAKQVLQEHIAELARQEHEVLMAASLSEELLEAFFEGVEESWDERDGLRRLFGPAAAEVSPATTEDEPPPQFGLNIFVGKEQFVGEESSASARGSGEQFGIDLARGEAATGLGDC